MTHIRFIMIISLMMVTMASCAGSGKLPMDQEFAIPSQTFSFDQKAYPSKMNLFPDYQMMPGDVLDVLFQVHTWIIKEKFTLAIDNTVSVNFIYSPELNTMQNVQPDGVISLPFVGEVKVAGLTIDQVTNRLKKKYGTVFRNPELFVTVPDYRNRIQELKKDLHTAPRGLSRLVTIRPDGYCTFPLVGDVFVANQTLPAINRKLNKSYQDFLPGLHIDLFLEKHSGTKVYVMGQVAESGAFNILKPISVLEAISMAGGPLNNAELSEIVVMRRKEKTLYGKRINLEHMLSVDHPDASYFYLRPDDVVYVPRTRISKVAQLFAEIEQLLFFRGWGLSFDGVLSEEPVFGPKRVR